MNREFLARYATALSTLIIFVIFSIVINNFFNATNIFMLLRQMSMLTIIALGFILVMGSGGFDMSIGNSVGLISMIFALIFNHTGNIWFALVISMACGPIVGFINGVLTAYVGLPDFIATFSVGSMVYGLKMMLTKGNPIFFPNNMPAFFNFIGQGYVGPLPFPVIVMLIVLLLFIFITRKTVFGRRLYAIGGNIVASIYAGINVKKYKVLAYLVLGFCVSIAAILLTSRLGSAQPLAGEDYLLDVIAVCFLSTTMFGNGEPTALGVFVGAFLISMLNNGLTMLNVQYYFQYITKGLVVVVAISLSILLGQKGKEKI
jgi:ribose/xylose/arabinose/galactoside ABC-type transport system permease subunit